MLPEAFYEEIENLSYRYMLKHEICTMTGANLEAMNDPDHLVGIAFLKGRYRRKAEYNDSVIKLSKQLSSPAMAIESKIAENAWLNDSKKR